MSPSATSILSILPEISQQNQGWHHNRIVAVTCFSVKCLGAGRDDYSPNNLSGGLLADVGKR